MLNEGEIQSTYDNWYSEQAHNEPNSEFISRSNKEAKKYIENYRISNPDRIFFAFVPGNHKYSFQ